MDVPQRSGAATGSSHGDTAPNLGAPPPLKPILFKPILQERIWGVERLPDWLDQPAPGHPIGEAWLTAESCVAEGAGWNGETLQEIAERFPVQMGNADGNGFPLLIKLLFPREKLSVQVHPNDTEAQAMGMPRGKSECWYVLEAEPGAEVAVGLREALPMSAVEAAIADGTLEGKLRYLPVKAGDMVYVDAGTIHAIGPGMTVLETQQYSDTTYRLYDYGRPRELHVEAGLAVSRTETKAGIIDPVAMDGFARLVSCPYFVVDRFLLEAGERASLNKGGQLQIVIALQECSLLDLDNAGNPPVQLRPGHACVLPANSSTYAVEAAAHVELIRVAQS